MGIRGLEGYLEKHSNACIHVRVIDLIHQYRRENHTPVIVVDGMSVMRFIYQFRSLSWVYGGQLKEYEETLKDFIDQFNRAGAELVFFFDGPWVSSKRETWIKRRIQSLNQINEMLDSLPGGRSIDYYDNGKFSLSPANLRYLTIYIAKKCGCKVYNSVRECDLEIAEYAADNHCLAILAQDSDFVIFESAKYYLSMKNFNFRRMTTVNYDRQKFAASLGLSTKHLPLLATLLGNDVVSPDDLKSFHTRMLHRKGIRTNQNWINFKILIEEVVGFIKRTTRGSTDYSQCIDFIASTVFSDVSKSSLIKDSLLSYDLSAEVNRDRGCPHSVNEKWNMILEKLHELHRSTQIPPVVYGIIIHQKYTCATAVEDYRKNDLPANQSLLKPLRQKLYGILLFEKPREENALIGHENEECLVEELVVCGPNSLDAPVFVKPVKPRVHHPGLLKLWSSGSESERWNLIGDMFEVDISKVKAFPPHLVVPALTLRYINSHVQIKDWELRGIISSVAVLQMYNASYLSNIEARKHIHDTRPFRLFTLISRSYSTTLFTFQALGNPLPLEKINPSLYQDGKLFHHKYWQSFNCPDEHLLCDRKEVCIQHYEQLMNFITDAQ